MHIHGSGLVSFDTNYVICIYIYTYACVHRHAFVLCWSSIRELRFSSWWTCAHPDNCTELESLEAPWESLVEMADCCFFPTRLDTGLFENGIYPPIYAHFNGDSDDKLWNHWMLRFPHKLSIILNGWSVRTIQKQWYQPLPEGLC